MAKKGKYHHGDLKNALIEAGIEIKCDVFLAARAFPHLEPRGAGPRFAGGRQSALQNPAVLNELWFAHKAKCGMIKPTR